MPLTSKALERCGVPAEAARANLPFITAAMREFKVTTQRRARMFLAQVLHESMRFTRFEEIASGAAYEGRKDLGNTERGDGVRFKGRGPIQITGRSNYTHYGGLLKLDLVRHPELAAQPRHGWRIAAAYFEHRGCNAAADRGDFEQVTRLINGGLLHLEERQRYYGLLAGVDVRPGRRRPRHSKSDRDQKPERIRHRDRADLLGNVDGLQSADAPARRNQRRLSALVAEVERIDGELNDAWGRIVAYRRRVRARTEADDQAELSAILLRIDEKLGTLVDPKRHDLSDEANAAIALERPPGAEISNDRVLRSVSPRDLSDDELSRRITELNKTVAACRRALIRRYTRAESMSRTEVKK
jgi:predicted chitinase